MEGTVDQTELKTMDAITFLNEWPHSKSKIKVLGAYPKHAASKACLTGCLTGFTMRNMVATDWEQFSPHKVSCGRKSSDH